MSRKPKPIIILVHGAWHVPEHYTSFIQQLKQSNFDVICPHLPTCNETTRLTATMYDDASIIREQIIPLLDQSHSIIMLLHSYGGAPGAEALKGLLLSERSAQGLPRGITHLIYMCGFMLQPGESVGSASLPRPVPDPVELDEGTKTTFLCEPPVKLFYADVEPKRAERMEALLVRQSGAAMAGTVTFPAWRYVPTTYLRTERDEVLFPEWQDRQIKGVRDAGVDLRVESFRASHSPYLSMPEEMVAAVKRAIE